MQTGISMTYCELEKVHHSREPCQMKPELEWTGLRSDSSMFRKVMSTIQISAPAAEVVYENRLCCVMGLSATDLWSTCNLRILRIHLWDSWVQVTLLEHFVKRFKAASRLNTKYSGFKTLLIHHILSYSQMPCREP